jgi:hypothetical protein
MHAVVMCRDKFGMNGFGGEITGNNNGEVEYKEFEA